MAQKYAFVGFNEHMARVKAMGLPISTKVSVEICRELRGKTTTRAKAILENVIDMKEAIPYRRFNKDIGHRKKMGPGRFPVSACQNFLEVVENAEANAQFKGLNVSSLKIIHIAASQGSRPMRYGRHQGRESKSTHVELIVEEKKSKAAKQKVEVKPAVKKAPTAPVIKKVEKPVVVDKEKDKAPVTEEKVKAPTPVKPEPKKAEKPVVETKAPAPVKKEPEKEKVSENK